MRNSYFAQSHGGHLLYLIFYKNWGLECFGIRQIRIQQPFPYLKIVYANFSAKMPTGLRNLVFPDLSKVDCRIHTGGRILAPDSVLVASFEASGTRSWHE